MTIRHALFFLLILLLSCVKNDETPLRPQSDCWQSESPKRIKSIHMISNDLFVNSSHEKHEFFFYDQNGMIDSIVNNEDKVGYKFFYKDGRISKMNEWHKNRTNWYNIEYQLIHKAQFEYVITSNFYSWESHFILNEKGLLEKKYRTDDNDFDIYEHDSCGNNIRSSSFYYKDLTNPHKLYESSFSSVYNPFYIFPLEFQLLYFQKIENPLMEKSGELLYWDCGDYITGESFIEYQTMENFPVQLNSKLIDRNGNEIYNLKVDYEYD